MSPSLVLPQRAVPDQETVCVLRKIPQEFLFGTTAIRRGETRVDVSDPTRTLVDILDDPKWGGGIRHMTRVLEVYLASEHHNSNLLLDYLDRVGN
jgi:predicted transcriptional regulator of viral defense system